MADGMPPHAMASLEGALTTALNAALRPEVAAPTAQPIGDHAAILASVHQRETDVRAREAAVHEREAATKALPKAFLVPPPPAALCPTPVWSGTLAPFGIFD